MLSKNLKITRKLRLPFHQLLIIVLLISGAVTCLSSAKSDWRVYRELQTYLEPLTKFTEKDMAKIQISLLYKEIAIMWLLFSVVFFASFLMYCFHLNKLTKIQSKETGSIGARL